MSLFNKIKNRFHCYKEDLIFAKRLVGSPWKRRIILLQTPEHTNIGDSGLVIAEEQFLNDHSNMKCIEVTKDEYLRYRNIIVFLTDKKDIIAIHAGGNMGNVWQLEEDCRRDIIKTFKNNKIISLPQTMYYENNPVGHISLQESIKAYSEHSSLILTAREKYSYDMMKQSYSDNKIYLMPDIVLYLTYKRKNIKRQGIMLCLRNDVEKALSEEETDRLIRYITDKKHWYSDMYCEEIPTIDNRKDIVYNKLDEFVKAELVVTDRLHGMVFATITETPCVVLSNNNHKVKGVYEWIKDLGYIEYINSVDFLPEAIGKVMSAERHYSNKKFIPYFEQIINEINEV